MAATPGYPRSKARTFSSSGQQHPAPAGQAGIAGGDRGGSGGWGAWKLKETWILALRSPGAGARAPRRRAVRRPPTRPRHGRERSRWRRCHTRPGSPVRHFLNENRDRRVRARIAPLDNTAAQLLFRLVSAAYERRALDIACHWPFDQWGRFLPEHTTAVSLLDRLLHHANVIVTDATPTACEKPGPKEEHA